jgi:hypothetical protein
MSYPLLSTFPCILGVWRLLCPPPPPFSHAWAVSDVWRMWVLVGSGGRGPAASDPTAVEETIPSTQVRGRGCVGHTTQTSHDMVHYISHDTLHVRSKTHHDPSKARRSLYLPIYMRLSRFLVLVFGSVPGGGDP